MTQITQELLKSLLSYDPDTGIFTWRTDRGRKKCAGTKAGWVASYGYINLEINSVNYRAHRLAWLYVYGVWPTKEIDHINQDKADNRISNLRDVTRRENCTNRKPFRNNTSSVSGVDRPKGRKKWRARVFLYDKHIHIGWYSTFEEAVAARLEAEKRYNYASANI